MFSSLIYPTVTENKDVVVIRQGYGSYQDFRVIDKSGNVSLLFTPGIVNDFGRIPLAKNKIAWLEFDKDPRWDKRVYSAVKILDMRTKKLIKNKIKGYVSSLDLSPDGKNFVVLEQQKFVAPFVPYEYLIVTKALKRFADEGTGLFVLINYKDAKSYWLNKLEEKEIEPKNNRRVIGVGSQILRALNLKKITVLGTPTKYNAVSGFDIEITGFKNE